MAVTIVDGPTPSGDGRTWELTFGDTRRPKSLVRVSMADEPPRGFRCVDARFESTGREELSTKWVARFPLTRCLTEARLACQQVLEDGDHLLLGGGLPWGYPNKANRTRWYPALLSAVAAGAKAGLTPMEVYREVARIKRVDVNRVKQWVWVGRRLGG